jgi:hypothetical protein
MPSGIACATAGSEMLPSIMEWKYKYETQHRNSLSPVAQVVTQLRLHFLIYSVLRSKLFSDLHYSNDPFIGEEKTQILQSVVGMVSSWVSPGSQIVQIIHGAYRYQLIHAIKTLFEVVAVCYERKNHLVIEQYDLLSYCKEVVNRCSRYPDGMKQFEVSWRKILAYLRVDLTSGNVK